ncbi:DUF6286 domain-containing protein [Streptomyces sp. TS71-3]|uniref:DUF6286 domain-containing protein n=1 Tax=Streptomyces sp. TS71-3 TaxID=2733862 RepID=UPI001B2528A2|nr:DUF6286 domain-containing protein [Streptomyces sp. TS71-3]GHJ38461.1 hypothetical protein Sm713_40700 [Streptomyces sp. TS71-3]
MSEPGGSGRPGATVGPGSRETGSTQRLPVLEKTTDGPGGPPSATVYNPLDPATKARRFWSSRRVPAGIVAVLVFAISGLFLYDIVSVRAGRSALQWRKSFAGDLATSHLDDTAVLAGAAAATALGLWLLLLAVTPGQRRLLPMVRTHADVRAALHRRAVSLVLRDRAMEVPGVQSAGVRTRRRGVRVRAVSHFRELDDVRSDLYAALSDGIRDLALARPPALTVHVTRASRKG